MPINSLLYPANSAVAGGYEVENSCRFNRGSSDTLEKTQSAGNRNTATFSAWIKRTELGSDQAFFGIYGAASDAGQIEIRFQGSTDQLHCTGYDTNWFRTNAVFRDVSAWYHIVVNFDTTQAAGSGNQFHVYVNGVEILSFAAAEDPQEDEDLPFGLNNSGLVIGSRKMSGGLRDFFSGYMAEVVFIDGLQLSPTSFGKFDEDSGIWKPIDVSGLTFGTNGFYLDFEDASNLGNDANGGTDLTEANLTAIDQSTDTCTNNFATMNPLETSPNGVVFSEGNLEVVGSGGNGGRITLGTFALNSGKWWCEVKMLNVNGSYPIVGIIDSQSSLKMDAVYFVDSGQDANNRSGYALFSNSDVYNNGDNNFGDFGATYTTNDIIGVGLDMDASTPTLTFQKNGGSEKTFTTEVPPSGFYNFPAIGFYFANAKVSVNFGNPAYTISSGNTDANGYGNFEYAPKSGYYSCCTKNLTEFG